MNRIQHITMLLVAFASGVAFSVPVALSLAHRYAFHVASGGGIFVYRFDRLTGRAVFGTSSRDEWQPIPRSNRVQRPLLDPFESRSTEGPPSARQ